MSRHRAKAANVALLQAENIKLQQVTAPSARLNSQLDCDDLEAFCSVSSLFGNAVGI